MNVATTMFSVDIAYDLMTLTADLKQRLIREYLQPHDLSMAEWRLLTVLANHASLPLSQLASVAVMDKGQASRMLQSLATKELVEIAHAATAVHATRRKMKAVSVTSTGSALFKRITNRLTKDQLKHEERILLRKICMRVAS